MNVKNYFVTFVVQATICMLASPVLHAQLPYPPKFKDARVETYLKIDSTDLKLWIFGESDSSVPKPAIVFFFGGGWNSGSPAQFENQAQHFAKRGMIDPLGLDDRGGCRIPGPLLLVVTHVWKRNSEPHDSTQVKCEVLVRFGVAHHTTPLSEGSGSISTTPSGSSGSVSKDGGLRKNTTRTTTPSASCGWWKRSKAWCEDCRFYVACSLFGHDSHLIHHPCQTDGVLCSFETWRV